MLVPAITKREEIMNKASKKVYSDEMFLMSGNPDEWWIPTIEEKGERGWYQWAIMDGEQVVGYFAYFVDYYSSHVSGFGFMSFESGHSVIGIDVRRKMLELHKRFHRIEWRMISGNPVERHYDSLCKKLNGRKIVLKDAVRDKYGNWRDDIIYEVINEEVQ